MRPSDLFWGSISAILGLVVAKDPRRVIFCGRHYGGNTAPLYERCQRFGLRGTWLTRDPKRIGMAEAIHTRTLAGVWAGARAGHVVLTHSLGDLTPLVFPRRTTRIWNVWHGMPIKRISRADPGFSKRPYAKSNLREQARYRGMFVTSKRMAEIFAMTFGLAPERIHVTGQPRNDILLGPPQEFLSRLPVPPPLHSHKILYCPTWREGQPTRLLPFTDTSIEQLEALLDELGALLFVRTHPNDFVQDDPLHTARSGRIIALQSDIVPEINTVLAAFDVLVTDYSSIYYDFLMLDRPTIFLPYDLERYAESPGMYLPFDEIAAGPTPRNQVEFAEALRGAIERPTSGAEARRRVADMAYERIDDDATRRVLEIIASG